MKSKNYPTWTHAIIMQGHEVLWDPSTKNRYKKGENLFGAVKVTETVSLRNVITGGYIIRVSDFSKLYKLDEYRKNLTPAEPTRPILAALGDGGSDA